MELRFTIPLLAVLLAAGTLPGLASADTDDTAEVTFRAAPVGFVVPSVIGVNNPSVWVVDPVEHPETTTAPGVAGCTIEVADLNGNGAPDGIDALNTAEEADCISSWSGRSDNSCTDGSDVFVGEVDGLEEAFPATFWLIQRNGQLASTGACDMALTDGEELSFVYE